MPMIDKIYSGTRKLNTENVAEQNAYAIISASEIPRLANLLMSMQCRSSLPMQMHINKYLADVTSAGLSFLVCPLSLSSDFLVTCVGDVAIEPPVVMKNDSWAALRTVLEPATPHPVAFKAHCMDSRLRDVVSKKLFESTGEPFANFLMIPCYLPDHEEPQLVVVLVDTVETDTALKKDLTLVGECSRYAAPTLRNTMVAEEIREHHHKLKLIISQVDEVARDITNDSQIIAGIKSTMEHVLRSESSALFLKEDKYLVSNSYEYGRPLDMDNQLKLPNLKIPLGVGMVGLVGTLGQIMITNDAQKEEIYCNVPSSSSHYRKVLGFPFIFKEKIFAVGEVYNKSTDYIESDKIYAEIIGKLFGPILKQSLKLRKANDTVLKKEVVENQLGMKKGKNPEDEVLLLKIRDLYFSKPISLDEFSKTDFLPSTVPDEDSINYILAALAELELIQNLRVKVDSLIRFLLFQRRHQLTFPFRNWFHSFCSFQFLYSVFKKDNFLETRGIDNVEAFAMLMATLCNGCDYKGATHRFQLESGIALASLYSSPGQRNELYAVQKTFQALNNPFMNFSVDFTQETHTKFVQLLDSAIMSTDVSNFASEPASYVFASQSSVDTSGDGKDEEHEKFCQLLMICSKISDHARIWEHALEIGDRLNKEFHRSKQAVCVTRVFHIPGIDGLPMRAKLQSHFISTICLPAFKILQKEVPELDEFVSNLETNLKKLDGLQKLLRKQELTELGEEIEDAGEYVPPDDDD